jgi:hypothetical protein
LLQRRGQAGHKARPEKEDGKQGSHKVGHWGDVSLAA